MSTSKVSIIDYLVQIQQGGLVGLMDELTQAQKITRSQHTNQTSPPPIIMTSNMQPR